jgi:hypothetical protein
MFLGSGSGIFLSMKNDSTGDSPPHLLFHPTGMDKTEI